MLSMVLDGRRFAGAGAKIVKPYVAALLFAAIAVVSFGCSAEFPELLTPVSESDEANVRAVNKYFLKKETYFAKQYRIVKVNTDLLLNADQIKISLFDDLSVALQVSSVNVHADEFTISWKGRFIEPNVSFDDLVAGGASHKEAEVLFRHFNNLNISAGQISFDETRRLKYPYYFPRFKKFQNSTRKFSSDGKSAVYDVEFLIEGVVLPKTYELLPLASDPQHHVLVEVDRNKLVTKPIDDLDSSYTETPENIAKRQQYRDFLNSLGPDPGPSDISKE